MEYVQPIRDKSKIEEMKRELLKVTAQALTNNVGKLLVTFD